MKNITDDRGFNQVWGDSHATRIRAERRCDYMISQMTVDASKRVMEIGCGTGRNSFMLARKTGMNVLGTDLCAPFVEEARENYRLPNLGFEVLNFNDVSRTRGEEFDYVIGNGILHHLYWHLDEALVNMRRILKDDGKIIFLEPNIRNPYVYFIFSYAALRKLARLEPEEMAFSKGFVTKKIADAGYKNIKVEYRDFLLPGVPDALIRPSIVLGRTIERIPVIRAVAQSLFVSGVK